MGTEMITANNITLMTLPSVCQQAAIIQKAGLLPISIKTPEAAAVVMLKGVELGIPPMQAIDGLCVINGKVSMQGQLMLALIYSRAPQAIIEFVKNDDKACVIKAGRNKDDVVSQFSFTIEEAEKAGLTKKAGDVWKNYTADMLKWRCVARMARTKFPDVIQGCYLPEEAAEIKVKRDDARNRVNNSVGDNDKIYDSLKQSLADSKNMDELKQAFGDIQKNKAVLSAGQLSDLVKIKDDKKAELEKTVDAEIIDYEALRVEAREMTQNLATMGIKTETLVELFKNAGADDCKVDLIPDENLEKFISNCMENVEKLHK